MKFIKILKLEFKEFSDAKLSKIRFYVLSFNRLHLGLQCISVGHHINLYNDYATKSELSFREYIKYCTTIGVEQVFDYWKERNKEISLLADKSPTHYEYLKKIRKNLQDYRINNAQK